MHTAPTPGAYCVQQLGLSVTKAFAMHIRNAERKFGYRPDKIPAPDDDGDLSVVVEDDVLQAPAGFHSRPSLSAGLPVLVQASL